MIPIWTKNIWCVLESPFHRVLCEGGVFRDHHHSIWVSLHPETIGSNVIKCHQCHQCHHHVFEYFLGWFSPHFFKIKTLLTLPWRGSWHASPGCPAPPPAAPVPGSRASCHHHFDKHCEDQMIILINIMRIRWSFSFKHHNDFSGSGRPFSIGWYHAPYPIDCYADFWCFSWLTWWWFSDVAKTDGLPKWRLNIQDDPRWWKIV